jgi:hypothetical protein
MKDIQITAQNATTVTFRKPGGRLTTLSRKEFESRFPTAGGPPAKRALPAAAAAPASSSTTSGFDPEAGAPSSAPAANDVDAIMTALDEIAEDVHSMRAQVAALFRVVCAQPEDEKKPAAGEAPRPPSTTSSPTG